MLILCIFVFVPIWPCICIRGLLDFYLSCMNWSSTATTVSIDTNHTRFELGQNTKNQHYERPRSIMITWQKSGGPRVKTPEHHVKSQKEKRKKKRCRTLTDQDELQKGALNGVDCVEGGWWWWLTSLDGQRV